MFFNPLSQLGDKISRTLRSMVLAAAAGAAGVAALFFFSLAGFLWLQQIYGTINASLAVGGAYAIAAVAALIAVVVLQRTPAEAPRATAAASQPQWWADPIVLTTGIQVLRILGRGRALPIALAAVLAGFMLGGSVSKRQKTPAAPRPKPNGRGTFDEARN